MTLSVLILLASKPPTYQPVDPLTIWVPVAGVLVVGALGFLGALYAANRAGANSDDALARTIAADREARVLERRLDLYADLLTFVDKRQQHRIVTMAAVKVNGWEPLDPFEPSEVFALSGRTRAIGDSAVLSAWEASEEADRESVRAWNVMQIARSEPGGVERVTKAFAAKEAADATDVVLQSIVRQVLHKETSDDATPSQSSKASSVD